MKVLLLVARTSRFASEAVSHDAALRKVTLKDRISLPEALAVIMRRSARYSSRSAERPSSLRRASRLTKSKAIHSNALSAVGPF